MHTTPVRVKGNYDQVNKYAFISSIWPYQSTMCGLK